MNTQIEKALHECQKEPIHTPGSIQPHGFLILANVNTHIIEQVSENISDFLPVTVEEVLHKPLNELPVTGLHEVLSLYSINGSFDNLNPSRVIITREGISKVYNIICHAWKQYIILEFEPPALNEDIVKNSEVVGYAISLFSSQGKLETILSKIALQIKSLIGYERVMIYRFAEDWHGEVLAEAKDSSIEDSFLGLHFPASDIPAQARQLYIKNVVRIIADSNSTVSPLKPLLIDQTPTNLENSVLRAVSPIHIQYLKNMGVGASFSISIIIDDKLWGLIACHNSLPRFIPFEVRQTCKLVSQILSSYIRNSLEEEDALYRSVLLKNEQILIENIREHWNIPLGLCKKEVNLMSVASCGGAALFFKNELHLVGNTPSEAQVLQLINWLQTANEKDEFFQTSILPEIFPAAKKFADVASGLMSICTSQYLKEYVLWFKPEVKKTVTWGGNPNQKVEFGNDGRVNPRRSFQKWQEQVSFTATPWKDAEISTAIKLKADLKEIISFQSNEIRTLNEKLLQANTELDAFSYTVTHDLKTPLSAILSSSQLLQSICSEKLGDDANLCINQIIAGSRKMDRMIKDILNYTKSTRESIQKKKIAVKPILDDIIQDIRMAFETVDSEFIITQTPDIHGDSTMIRQVFQNILSNAVKYNDNKDKKAVVKVNGWSENSNTIYTIQDNGIGIDMRYASKIFEIFARLDNGINREGHGVGLAIVKRIVERHDGKIWIESTPGNGTTFYLSYPELN